MGKVSIFKAANAENSINLKKEMEEAIRYFEKSSRQDSFSKPAKFCLPFYRSFYSITFKKEKPETGSGESSVGELVGFNQSIGL